MADIIGTSGNDLLSGTEDSDVVSGLGGDDRLDGLGGDDWLDGGDGQDTLVGGKGNDTLVGGPGADVVDGGFGIDWLVFGAELQAVRVDLGNNLVIADGAVDAVSSIEVVVGSGFDDVLTGGAAGDTLMGEAGHDQIDGGVGADVLAGGKGNDLLAGGAGGDRLQPDTGFDTVVGGADTDTLVLGGRRADFGVGEVEPGTQQLLHMVSAEMVIVSEVELVQFDDGLFTMNELLGLPGEGQFITGDDGANVLVGADGNDTIVGLGGDDLLDGAAGQDSLSGGKGNDTLIGGAGSDFIDGGFGVDLVDFGSSADSVQVDLVIGVAFAGFDVDTLAGIDGAVGSQGPDLLTGHAGDNLLSGGAGNDQIDGGAGNDILLGGKGDDILFGGAGADLLWSDGGTDVVFGGQDIDTLVLTGVRSQYTVRTVVPGLQHQITDLSGATVADVLEVEFVQFADGVFPIEEPTGGGTEGDDRLTGDDNDNLIDGLGGNDTITGLGGNDDLRGGLGDDLLDGGQGADLLSGDFGSDTYVLDAPEDQVLEFGGVDGEVDVVQLDFSAAGVYIVPQGIERVEVTALGALAIDVVGGFSSLTLIGGAGPNALTGGKGSDVLDGGLGDDVLVGGQGFDTADYGAAPGGVSVNLATSTAGGAYGADRLVGIEAMQGSGFNDTLVGDGLYNIVYGGAGADLIDVGAGGSWIDPGPGNDTVRGGTDEDWLSYAALPSGVVVDLKKGTVTGAEGTDQVSGIDNVIATAFSDRLTGDRADNFFAPNGGDDVIDGGAGLDTVWVYPDAAKVIDLERGLIFGGGSTVAVQNVEIIHATGFDDTMLGGRSADALHGGEGQDELRGARGNDSLFGEGGNDRLWGDDGDDLLAGGQGDDLLTGGAGRDRFEVADVDWGFISDTVADFQPGTDTIVLSAQVLTALAGVAGTRVDPDTNLFLDYDKATGVLSYDADGPAGQFGALTIVMLGTTNHPAELGLDILVQSLG
ncbi:hypothetical protein [Ideonella sp. A 288]|uniref:calcium-binding protein n=1 Tax=Ideonella sp. A 288 TaxID=1962181 RepID=UPI001303AE67|nr:hypothetical protein [Ideonella sp. A 288]